MLKSVYARRHVRKWSSKKKKYTGRTILHYKKQTNTDVKTNTALFKAFSLSVPCSTRCRVARAWRARFVPIPEP